MGDGGALSSSRSLRFKAAARKTIPVSWNVSALGKCHRRDMSSEGYWLSEVIAYNKRGTYRGHIRIYPCKLVSVYEWLFILCFWRISIKDFYQEVSPEFSPSLDMKFWGWLFTYTITLLRLETKWRVSHILSDRECLGIWYWEEKCARLNLSPDPLGSVLSFPASSPPLS